MPFFSYRTSKTLAVIFAIIDFILAICSFVLATVASKGTKKFNTFDKNSPLGTFYTNECFIRLGRM